MNGFAMALHSYYVFLEGPSLLQLDDNQQVPGQVHHHVMVKRLQSQKKQLLSLVQQILHVSRTDFVGAWIMI